jgi:hypothetical protein
MAMKKDQEPIFSPIALMKEGSFQLLQRTVAEINARITSSAKLALSLLGRCSGEYDLLRSALEDGEVTGLLCASDLLNQVPGQLPEKLVQLLPDRDIIHAIVKHFWFIEEAVRVICFGCNDERYYSSLNEVLRNSCEAHFGTKAIDLVGLARTKQQLQNELRMVIRDPGNKTNAAVFAALALRHLVTESNEIVYGVFLHKNRQFVVNIWTLGIAFRVPVPILFYSGRGVDPFLFFPFHSPCLEPIIAELMKPAAATMYSLGTDELSIKFSRGFRTAELPSAIPISPQLQPAEIQAGQDRLESLYREIYALRCELAELRGNSKPDATILKVDINKAYDTIRKLRYNIKKEKKTAQKPHTQKLPPEILVVESVKPNLPNSQVKKTGPRIKKNENAPENADDESFLRQCLAKKEIIRAAENRAVKNAILSFLVVRESGINSVISTLDDLKRNVYEGENEFLLEVFSYLNVEKFDLYEVRNFISLACRSEDERNDIVMKYLRQISKKCLCEIDAGRGTRALENYIDAAISWVDDVNRFRMIDYTLLTKYDSFGGGRPDSVLESVCGSIGLNLFRVFFMGWCFGFNDIRNAVRAVIDEIGRLPKLQQLSTKVMTPYTTLETILTQMREQTVALCPFVLNESTYRAAVNVVPEILQTIEQLYNFIIMFSEFFPIDDLNADQGRRVFIYSTVVGCITVEYAGFKVRLLKSPFCLRSFLEGKSEISMIDALYHFKDLKSRGWPTEETMSGLEFLEWAGVPTRVFVEKALSI